jgi:hypothetical protein
MTAINGIQDGALQHHERYDGTGYPNKIKGAEISLVGRILCVADAFDAMNSDRCYRDKLPMDKIKDELNGPINEAQSLVDEANANMNSDGVAMQQKVRKLTQLKTTNDQLAADLDRFAEKFAV